MPSILPPLTQLEIDINFVNEPVTIMENNVRSGINNLDQSFNIFWSLPDPQIDAILNFEGLSTMQAVFSSYRAYGSCFNSILEDRGIDSPRSALSTLRIVLIDEFSIMSVIPLSTMALSTFNLSSYPLSSIVNFNS